MAESTASKNERINDYIADITAVSLHTADPGSSGTSEVVGGSPAYARKAPSFTAASAGGTNLSTPLSFDVPGGGTAPSHYGLWKGSTFLGGEPLSATETFSGQGTLIITSLPLTA